MGFKGDMYIWKDRKRFMGMPLSFTRYALSDDRLFLSVGFFSVNDEEILLYRIRDISSKRNLWQRIFGVGTVTVASSDKTTPQVVLKNIKFPLDFKELLHKNVEECKMRRRMRYGEIMGGMDHEPDDTDNDLDDLDDILNE